MKIYSFLMLMLAGLAGIAQKHTGSQPNIIIINMDDMGYGDIEAYGMTGVSTPNFNRLARQGMRFTHFNSAQAVCTASRAALLTGCYPNRIGLSTVFSPFSGPVAPYWPLTYGFDSFYGLPGSNDFWRVDYPERYTTIPIIEGNTIIDSIVTREDQDKLTTTYTEKAVAFIKSSQKKPFFLYLAHSMPHVPLAVSSKFKGKSSIGLYGDVIMELDWSLGEIIKTLDLLKLSANTMVIVTSDNGPWMRYGNNGGSSGGLREGKSTAFEGGVRVPCLIKWPGKVEAGGVSGQLLTNMDLLPTIVEITGAAYPREKIDGLSFKSHLFGQTSKGPREVFYYYYNANNLKAVRYKNWKLVLPHQSQSYESNEPGQNRVKGNVTNINIRMALYDLAHDPGEEYDVQKSFPEIVKQIQTFVEEARADLGDDITGRKANNVRPAAVIK
jgi:arylsulfatase